jgi:glycosyltransferase involved in cell wall biosynthesis
MKRVAIVIPAFNEESNIAGVVGSIQQLEYEGFELCAVVVNDCSRDQTAAVARKTGAVLLDLPINLGIGGAVQTGLRYALQQGFDYAMQVDGDGQHPAEEIPTLIAGIESSGCDVLIGSRFLERKGFQSSAARRAGIIYFRRLIQLLCGIDISDATSGFRILNRKALSIAAENYPDEYPEPESLILFHLSGIKITEAPVVMHERKGGRSSINRFDAFYYMVKVSLAIFYTFIRVKTKLSKYG